MSTHRKLTSEELVAELRERFGDNYLDWAFRCPRCGDVATGGDFSDALADHPRTGSDGECYLPSQLLGQECIGRTLGTERGCDWAAYGLFRGPWEIVLSDGTSVWGFPIADARPAEAVATGGAR